MTAQQRREFELSGVKTQRGVFDRPLNAGTLVVYRPVKLVKKKLYYGRDKREVKISPNLLQDFIALADTTDSSRIVDFATQWGTLGICRHDMPFTHFPPRGCNQYLDFINDTASYCMPRMVREGKHWTKHWHWEPISAWTQTAKEAKAILNLAAQLNMGKLGNEEDWKTLEQGPRCYIIEELWSKPTVWLGPPLGQRMGNAERRQKLSTVTPLQNQLWCLQYVLRQWVELADLRPGIAHKNGKWEISFFTGGLFQGLALQLMLAVTTTAGLGLCSHCRNSYQLERRPNTSRRSYCPACRAKGIPLRDAAREYRKRKNEGNRK